MDRKQINEAVDELATLCDLLRWGTSCFNAAGLCFGHGTDNAWDEALALALYVLHLPYDIKSEIIYTRLTTSERRKIVELYALRVNSRIPAAYITHQAWFAGLSFYIDKRVIIPRSPMAELIENHFSPWITEEDVHNVMDLCTGSGCIAIACAKYFPHAEIDAVDISDDALAVTRINLEQHQIGDQVKPIKSDLFTKIKDKKYEVIIANPPYVDAHDMAHLPAEFQHEPRLALAAGDDGLAAVRRILKEAANFLTEQGVLIVEVGNSDRALMEAYPNVLFYWLEFTRGDDGVFLLTREQLLQYQKYF